MPTDAFIGVGKEGIAPDGARALVVPLGHPSSGEQNVALFESDTWLAGGLFKV